MKYYEGFEKLMAQLRSETNDQTLNLFEDAEVERFLTEYNMSVQYVKQDELMQMPHEEFISLSRAGVVFVPSDSPAGRSNARAHNIAYLYLRNKGLAK